jgi:hypothetical protein
VTGAHLAREFDFVGEGLAPPAVANGAVKIVERISSNAKERIETEIEIENAPRRQEALQVHGQRED